MSQLAVQHKAVNMGQGFPDYSPDPRLIECVHQAMLDGHNQYAPMAGVAALRGAVRDKVISLYGHDYDPDLEITITAGATEALSVSLMALIHPGDEVIVIEPAYDLYAPVIRLAGGTPRYVAMHAPDAHRAHYTVDWDAVESAIHVNTRMLILNFPNNPTGLNLCAADLDRLEQIVRRHDVLLLSDEAYEHIVFDGAEHRSMASRPALAERSLVISSFGKTFHATGWKVGYLCAPRELSAEIRKVHQYAVFSVATPLQVGLANYLNTHAEVEKLKAFYQKKRDRLISGLQGSMFRPLESQGTFFVLVDYSALCDLPEKQLAQRLTVTPGIGTIPVSAFYQDPTAAEANHALLRLCFAKQDQTLDAAIELLQTVRSV
jgi:methionine aminotransferase